MVCEKCGEKINIGLKFCTKCGEKIIYMSGKGFLVVMITGILFIINAVFSVIYSIFSQRFYFDTSLIILLINFIFSISIGFLGIKYCKSIEKAKLLMCFALIGIAFYMIYFIIFLELSLGFILSICFLIGTIMNLKTKGGK